MFIFNRFPGCTLSVSFLSRYRYVPGRLKSYWRKTFFFMKKDLELQLNQNVLEIVKSALGGTNVNERSLKLFRFPRGKREELDCRQCVCCLPLHSSRSWNGWKIPLFKVNRQRPTSVMLRPELKISTQAKWLISRLVRAIIKICKKHLVLQTNSNINIYNEHEFLYNSSCKPVCQLLSIFRKCQISQKPLIILG